MQQISRPLQIALIAILGIAMLWLVALRGHGGAPGSSTSASVPAPIHRATHTTSNPPTHLTHVYHGPAPGVEGLTRDVQKAHRAVKEAENSSGSPEGSSTKSSNSAKTPASTSTASKSPANSAQAVAPKHSTSTQSSTSSSTSTSTHTSSEPGISAVATEVEHEISHGKTVLLFFWNPKSLEDKAVHKQLTVAAHQLGSKVVIHAASAGQIGMFGQVTQDIHVNQTPTILIINDHRLVTTVSGLTDAFSIKQAVSEAEQPTGH